MRAEGVPDRQGRPAELGLARGAAADRSKPPRLAVRGLRVRRAGRLVLDGLTFEVSHREVFGLLGPNGAGKTTAFQVLAGLVEPEDGSLLLDGNPLAPSSASFRSRIGVVFQEAAADPRLSPLENLLLAGALYGVADLRGRAWALLERFGLADRAREPAGRLSGGMRRRLEIARALLHDPLLLFLDEPTSGLDEAAFRTVWDYLLELRRERAVTMLVTTHRPEEAERCDRLGVLDRGRLLACDTPDNLRAVVRGDLLVLEVADAAAVASEIAARFGLEARAVEGRVFVERERGHELIPRLVEALPRGTLGAISLRRPGLGEAFLAITGRELEGEGTASPRRVP